MAMERVERRLRRVTAALDAAGIPYAVCGGNAVAVWVARIDPGATRTTKDVDLLVNKADLKRLTEAMTELGFLREDLRSITLFLDPDEPSRKTGVHLVWAGERVRPSYAHPAPSVEESRRDLEDFAVVDLGALVRMKLTSFRRIDQVHIEDLLGVDAITDSIRGPLPADLSARLREIEESME